MGTPQTLVIFRLPPTREHFVKQITGITMAIRQRNDRLSALPDALIHEIFSYLDMSEIIDTGILSNRWRSLWLSTPNLNFDLDNWIRKYELCTPWVNGRVSFMDFVEKVLFLRENSNIFMFKLYSYREDFDFVLPRVSSWLIKVLALNVRHIVLRFPLGYDIKRLNLKLPKDLFNSSVRVLEIDSDPLLQWPDIYSTSRIKNLQLRGVKLPDGNANGELILSCGFLEDLSIDYCDVEHLKVITISTPLLETLHVRLFMDRTVRHRVKVKTRTENLKSLSFVSTWSQSDISVDFDIEGDLLYLVNASIYIFNKIHLMKIIPKVCNAHNLDLGLFSKQFLTDFPVSLKGIPYHFHNLRYVNLADEIEAPFSVILNFLASFPHIETLVWNIERIMKKALDVEEESETNMPLECMFTCLKTVEIVNLHGVERELKFLAFILERALLLAKVIIKCKPALSDEKIADFQEKFLSFSRASPNISLTLL